jgi:hypothetical protein
VSEHLHPASAKKLTVVIVAEAEYCDTLPDWQRTLDAIERDPDLTTYRPEFMANFEEAEWNDAELVIAAEDFFYQRPQLDRVTR